MNSIKDTIRDEDWLNVLANMPKCDFDWTDAISELFDKDNHMFVWGWTFSNLEYINSTVLESLNPTIKMRLTYGEKSIEIAFLYTLDFEMVLKRELDEYYSYQEEVERSILTREKGVIIFACEFTFGLRVYVKSSGITVKRL